MEEVSLQNRTRTVCCHPDGPSRKEVQEQGGGEEVRGDEEDGGFRSREHGFLSVWESLD